MAATVAFSVYGSLIRPAISLTPGSGSVMLLGAGNEVSGDPLEIGQASSSSSTGVYTVEAKVTKDDKGSPKKYYADLTAKFNLTAETVQSLNQHANAIKFNVGPVDSEGFEFDSSMKSTGDVFTSGDDKAKIGTYVFDPSTGDVTITFDFTVPYFDGRQGEAIGGGFNFQAWTWNQDNSQEDKSFSIAGNDVVVPIYRYTHTADLSVKKSYNNDFFYQTEGATMGTGDDAKRGLGSSFRIDVSSRNGVDGAKVTFTDTLTCDDVHFDLVPGSTWKLYDANGNVVSDPVLTIDSITTIGSDQVLTASLTAADQTLLSRGFDYYWNCPVTVNEEHLNENGEVHVVRGSFESIEGSNVVSAKAKNVPETVDDARIQVGLVADITKGNGTYDPETNTVEWRISVHKENGWWQNGTINIDDFMGGDGSKENPGDKAPELYGTPVMTFIDSDDNEHQIVYDPSNPNQSVQGVHPVEYSDGRFTITMDRPTSGDWTNYNETPVKEFVIYYKTKVSSEDYGKTEYNWVGLVDPEDPDGYVRIDPDKHVTVSKPDVSKDHALVDDGIQWTITVDNRAGQDLVGLDITDTLSQGGTAQTPPDLSTAVLSVGGTVVPITDVFDVNGNVLTFKEGVSANASSYEITYVQQLDVAQHKNESFQNDVKIENDEEILDEDVEDAHIPKEHEVDKSGYLGADGLMHYKVSFINQYGDDLYGEQITDVLTITKKDGTPVNAADFDFTVVSPATGITSQSASDGNTITTTFTVDASTTQKRLDIEYVVKPANSTFITDYGYYLHNEAEWGDERIPNDETVDQFVSLSEKTASYDKNTDLITWMVTVYNPYGVDLSTLGYPLEDTMFDSGIRSFNVTDANGTDVTQAGDLEAVRAGAYEFHEGMNSDSYTFTYKTKLPDPVGLTEQKISVTNDVTYGQDEKTKTIDVYPWEMNKNSSKSASATDPDSEGSFEILWTLKLGTYNGGFLYAMEQGYEIGDNMSVRAVGTGGQTKPLSSEDAALIKNYIPADEFDINTLFTLKTKSYTTWDTVSQGLEPGDLFELVKVSEDADGNVTAFKVLFKQQTDENSDEYKALRDANELELSYVSRAEGADVLADLNKGEKLVYDNTLSFPGTPDKTATHEIEKKPAISKYIQNYDYASYQEVYTVYDKSFGLSKIAHDNELDCYYVKYMLGVNQSRSYGADQDITVTDTLPEGMDFVSGEYALGAGGERTPMSASGVSWAQNGRELTFTVPGNIHGGGYAELYYTVKIEDEVMDALLADTEQSASGAAVFENTAQVGDDFDTITTTFNDDVPKISKTASEYRDNGNLVENAVSYTLDINPNARKLLPDDQSRLTVTDTINQSDADQNYARCPILFSQLTANSIHIYKVVGDQQIEMDIGEFGFTEPERKTLPVYGGNLGEGDVYTFKLTVPDETHIRIVYNYQFEFNEKAKNDDSYNADQMVLKNNAAITGQNATANKDFNQNFNKYQSSGAYASTINNISLRKFSSDNWLESLGGAQFVLMRCDNEGKWQTLTGVETVAEIYEWLENDHSHETNYNATTFGAWSDGVISASDGARVLITEAQTGQIELPCLQKYVTRPVDVGGVSETRNYYTIDELPNGQQRYVYVLREIKAPTGYTFDEGTRDHYFFEQPKDETASGCKPALAIAQTGVDANKVEAVRSGTKIELENDAKELRVKKFWNTSDQTAVPDEVEFKLYRTLTQPAPAANTHKVTLTIEQKYDSSHRETYTFIVRDGDTFSASTPCGVSCYGAYNNNIGYANSQGIITFTSDQPVTKDTEFFAGLNLSDFTTLKVRSDNSVVNTSSGKPTDSEFVKDITLTKGQDWQAVIDGIDFSEGDYYYYLEETGVDGFDANYYINGIELGTFEVINNSYESGSITVNKSWLGDEADVDKLTFDIVGYTEKAPQEPSEYSQSAGASDYVTINFQGADNQDNHYVYDLKKYFVLTPGETYTLNIGGRSYTSGHVKKFDVNSAASSDFWQNQTGPGCSFNITAGQENTNVDINVSYSYGISTNYGWWNAPTSDDYLFSVTSGGQDVTVFDSKSDLDSYIASQQTEPSDTYSEYTPTLPQGTPVISKTLTVTKDGTTGKWSGTYDGLPLTSGGQPIYYYVVERGSSAFTPIDYSKNGFVLEENKTSSVTVTNQSQEVDAYELPEAGGEGTTLYIITGSGLMLGAMVLFTVKKRKAQS